MPKTVSKTIALLEYVYQEMETESVHLSKMTCLLLFFETSENELEYIWV